MKILRRVGSTDWDIFSKYDRVFDLRHNLGTAVPPFSVVWLGGGIKRTINGTAGSSLWPCLVHARSALVEGLGGEGLRYTLW